MIYKNVIGLIITSYKLYLIGKCLTMQGAGVNTNKRSLRNIVETPNTPTTIVSFKHLQF